MHIQKAGPFFDFDKEVLDGVTRLIEARDTGIGVEQGRRLPAEVARFVAVMQDTTQNCCSVEQGRRACRIYGMANVGDVTGRVGFSIPD